MNKCVNMPCSMVVVALSLSFCFWNFLHFFFNFLWAGGEGMLLGNFGWVRSLFQSHWTSKQYLLPRNCLCPICCLFFQKMSVPHFPHTLYKVFFSRVSILYIYIYHLYKVFKFIYKFIYIYILFFFVCLFVFLLYETQLPPNGHLQVHLKDQYCTK